MKWLLMLLFPIQLLAQVQVLPPGVYKDLRPTKPIVLKKGSYTFMGLEMGGKVPPSGVRGPWIDGRKADTARFYHCTFTGLEKGTILKMSGVVIVEGCVFEGKAPDQQTQGIDYLNGKRLMVRNCTFSNLSTALHFNASGATNRSLHFTRNKFTNNLTSIELTNGTIDFQLRCNEFITPNPTPTGQTRYGLRIGEDVVLVGNRIGGNNTFANPGPPNSNRWPLSSLEWNPLATPDPILPQPFTGFVSIENQSDNDITYWRYDNEFLGDVVNSGSGEILPLTLSPTTPTYTYTLIDVCQLYNNCGQGSLQNCLINGFLPNRPCANFWTTLPTSVNWVRACEGSTTDQVDWPIFIPRPGLPDSAEWQTQALKEIKPGIQLGQSRPNPGRDKISIPYFLPQESGLAEIWINEVSSGREVGRFMLKSTGPGELQVDVSGLSSGVYAYRLTPQVGKSPSTMKFIVIR